MKNNVKTGLTILAATLGSKNVAGLGNVTENIVDEVHDGIQDFLEEPEAFQDCLRERSFNHTDRLQDHEATDLLACHLKAGNLTRESECIDDHHEPCDLEQISKTTECLFDANNASITTGHAMILLCYSDLCQKEMDTKLCEEAVNTHTPKYFSLASHRPSSAPSDSPSSSPTPSLRGEKEHKTNNTLIGLGVGVVSLAMMVREKIKMTQIERDSNQVESNSSAARAEFARSFAGREENRSHNSNSDDGVEMVGLGRA